MFLITAIDITGHETPVLVGFMGTIKCSTLLNVSKLEWYIRGFEDPVESKEDSNFIVLPLSPVNTALSGTSIICRVTTYGGKTYEDTVTIMVKGDFRCKCVYNLFSQIT